MAEIDVSFLIPLLLLVVAGLANVSRQVKLVEVANETHDDVYLLQGGPVEELLRPLFELSLSPGERVAERDADHDLSGQEPKFGRFNHIHGFSSLLLAVALVLTAHSQASLNGALLAGIIAVFWMVLPILEINEYDLMMRHFEPEDPLYSLTTHIALVGALAVPAVAAATVDVAGYPLAWKAAAALAYVVAGVLVGNVFQSQLRDEIETLRERGVTASPET